MKHRILVLMVALSVAAFAVAQGTDRYRITYDTEPKTLNYFYLIDITSQRVAANTQDHLVENDRFGRFIPALAERWTTNENATVWTFYLRKGVKWVDHTGKVTEYEVTADDFYEGFRYVADPKNGIKNFGSIRSLLVGLADYYKGLQDVDSGKDKNRTRQQVLDTFKNVGIRVIDKYTIEYTTVKPTPWFLTYLTMDLFFPVEKAFMDKVGAENFGTARDKLIFSGCYYISDWQRDKLIVLRRNENYWDKKNVLIREITMQKVSDPAIALQMFQRGELSSAGLNADQVKGLQNTKWKDYVYMTDRSSVTFWWALNFQSKNPEFAAFVKNLNFRKALYYGIDHVKLLSLDDPLNPQNLLRTTVIPEEVIFDEKGKDYTDYPGLIEFKKAGNTFNAKLAKEYFMKAVAELTDGKGNIKGVNAQAVDLKPVAQFNIDGKLPVQILLIHSTSSTDTKFALLMQAMFKEVFGPENVEVVLGQYVDDQYDEVIAPQKFDMAYDSFRFAYGDPLAQLGRLITGGAVNDGGWSDPEFDALVAEADKKIKLSDRYALFAKAEAMILDRVYIIPFRCGGSAYTIGNVVPYTYPRSGFGVTRFKYKGMKLESKPLLASQVEKIRSQFYADLEKLQGK